MKPNLLFHVPGCKDIYDNQEQKFIFDRNWLTLDEFRDKLPDQFKPQSVEVIQTNGSSKIKLGMIESALISLKFGN